MCIELCIVASSYNLLHDCLKHGSEIYVLLLRYLMTLHSAHVLYLLVEQTAIILLNNVEHLTLSWRFIVFSLR